MAAGEMEAIAELAKHPKVVAIGEVGLDYYYEHSPRETQQARLADFVELARTAGKPLVIHCRDAFEIVFGFLTRRGLGRSEASFMLQRGMRRRRSTSLQGFYVVFLRHRDLQKSQVLQEAARTAALEKILIETIALFLPRSRIAASERAGLRAVGRREGGGVARI
jgi:TatD DNase family protein